MTKEWSHLPNANHIDWVIKTLKENPEVWNAAEGVAWAAARNAARYAAWGDAWDAARDDARAAARSAARAAAWDTTRGDVWEAVWDAAGGATAALVAWDESSELLTMPITHVERLVKLEIPAAILLLPAVIVKNKLKELEND